MVLNIILIISLCITLYGLYNLVRKNESLEEIIINREGFIRDIKYAIFTSSERLHEVDANGTFSTDDEVGFFFEDLKQISNDLNEYILNSEV